MEKEKYNCKYQINCDAGSNPTFINDAEFHIEGDFYACSAKELKGNTINPEDSNLTEILRAIAPKVGKGKPYKWGLVFQALVRREFISKQTSILAFAKTVETATGVSADTVRKQGDYIYDIKDKSAIDSIVAEIDNLNQK